MQRKWEGKKIAVKTNPHKKAIWQGHYLSHSFNLSLFPCRGKDFSKWDPVLKGFSFYYFLNNLLWIFTNMHIWCLRRTTECKKKRLKIAVKILISNVLAQAMWGSCYLPEVGFSLLWDVMVHSLHCVKFLSVAAEWEMNLSKAGSPLVSLLTHKSQHRLDWSPQGRKAGNIQATFNLLLFIPSVLVRLHSYRYKIRRNWIHDGRTNSSVM